MAFYCTQINTVMEIAKQSDLKPETIDMEDAMLEMDRLCWEYTFYCKTSAFLCYLITHNETSIHYSANS